MSDEKKELTPEELRKATVKAYRHLGFLLEAHPELPAPSGLWIWPSSGEYHIQAEIGGYRDELGKERVRERMGAIAKSLRKSYFRVEKDMSGSTFKLTVPLGDVYSLVISCSKEEVCERKVVGTRAVQRPIERVVTDGYETAYEDVVEWDCTEPLLGGKS